MPEPPTAMFYHRKPVLLKCKLGAIQEMVSLDSIFSVFNKSWFWLGLLLSR